MKSTSKTIIAEETPGFREIAVGGMDEESPSALKEEEEESTTVHYIKSTLSHGKYGDFQQKQIQQNQFIGQDAQLQQLIGAFRRCTRRILDTADDKDYKDNGIIAGRRLQQQQQRERKHNNNRELILITGVSGSGKTTLANHGLRRVVEEETDGYFISGKFDMPQKKKPDLRATDPHHAVKQALTDLALQLRTRSTTSSSNTSKIKEAIKTVTKTDKSVLDLTPALRGLLLNSDDKRQEEQSVVKARHDNSPQAYKNQESCRVVEEDGMMEIATNFSTSQQDTTKRARAQERFNDSVCDFMRAIVSVVALDKDCERAPRSHPIVLFLDDLQWACQTSLALMTALVLADIQGLVVVGSCRSDEVGWDSALSEKLRALEEVHGVHITDIQMGNLDRDEFEKMAENLLGGDRGGSSFSSTTRDGLLEKIYQHTHGNVFFSLEYLRFISTSIKEGETEVTPSKNDSFHDICELFEAKIRQQAPNLQTVLRFAASFGNEFDQTLLGLVTGLPDVDINLRIAAEEGFVVRHTLLSSFSTREDRGKNSTTTWRFKHDKIHQSAYALIGATGDERDSFHLSVGRTLLNSLSTARIEEHILSIVGHFQGRLQLITDAEERNTLAELFLVAGIKLTRQSAFDAALHNFNLGIDLLGYRHWRDQYALSLELYSSAAEVEFCVASDLTRMNTLIEAVRQNSRTKIDMTRALTASVYSLGSRNDTSKATDLAFTILRDIGEPLPKHFGIMRVIVEFIKTKRMLKPLSDEDILNLPPMQDPTKLSATRILNLILVYTITSCPKALPFVAMRLMQQTVKYGLSRMSPASISAFAMLCGAMNQLEMAARYGYLSLELLRRSKSREWVSRVHFSVYSYGLPGAIPWSDCIEPLLVGYQMGLSSGDVEAAFSCMVMYQCLVIQCGCVPLDEGLLNSNVFRQAAVDHQQTHALQHSVVQVQFMMNMCGKSEYPKVLKGDACDLDEVRKVAREKGMKPNLEYTYFVELILGCHFQDHGIIEDCLNYLAIHGGSNLLTFMATDLLFYSGLACTALYYKQKQGRYLRSARKWYKKLCAASKKEAAQNLMPRLKFLEVEIESAADGNPSDIVTKYDQAIVLCGQERMWNVQGLACERAAFARKRLGHSREDSVEYLNKAKESYAKWRATALVHRIDQIGLKWH